MFILFRLAVAENKARFEFIGVTSSNFITGTVDEYPETPKSLSTKKIRFYPHIHVYSWNISFCLDTSTRKVYFVFSSVVDKEEDFSSLLLTRNNLFPIARPPTVSFQVYWDACACLD